MEVSAARVDSTDGSRAWACAAALFLPYVVFGMGPNAVILGNLSSLGYSRLLVWGFLLALGGSGGLLAILFVAASKRVEFRALSRGVLLIGVSLLIFSLLRGRIDGSARAVRQLINAEVAVFVFLGAVAFIRHRGTVGSTVARYWPLGSTVWGSPLLRTTILILAVPVLGLLVYDIDYALHHLVSLGMWSERHLTIMMITVELGAILGAAILLALSAYDGLVAFVGCATLCLCIQGAWRHVTTVRNYVHYEQAQRDSERDYGIGNVIAPDRPRPEGNVYHIILDAYPRDAYSVITAQAPDLALKQFLFFPQFVANYGRTAYSLNSTLTGSFLPEGMPANEWVTTWIQVGLWRDLADNGVVVWRYPHQNGYCRPDGERCPVAWERVPGEDPAERDSPRTSVDKTLTSKERLTLDLWFHNLLPPSVLRRLNAPYRDALNRPRGERLSFGFSITDALLPRATTPLPVALPSQPLPAPIIPLAHDAAYTMLNFEQCLYDEGQRPDTGQYVFFHALIPHGPYILDETCEYAGEVPQDLAQFMAACECGLRLVHRFIARLEELGRLHDALIIVQADHGHGLQPEVHNLAAQVLSHAFEPKVYQLASSYEVPSKLWPSDTVAAHAGALLLVKFPGNSAGGVSPAPAQAIDLAPTVLHHVGLPTDSYPGIPIQNLTSDVDREVVFWGAMVPRTANWPKTFSKFVYDGEEWHYAAEISSSM